jgi:hypothetical protein
MSTTINAERSPSIRPSGAVIASSPFVPDPAITPSGRQGLIDGVGWPMSTGSLTRSGAGIDGLPAPIPDQEES